jgi:hypothetical protein
MAEQQRDDAPVRSPLPSAGEIDAEIERKLQEWDARRKREAEPDKPTSSNGALPRPKAEG